jgi:hypothetical protein
MSRDIQSLGRRRDGGGCNRTPAHACRAAIAAPCVWTHRV